jgi:hypothetical protein
MPMARRVAGRRRAEPRGTQRHTLRVAQRKRNHEEQDDLTEGFDHAIRKYNMASF